MLIAWKTTCCWQFRTSRKCPRKTSSGIHWAPGQSMQIICKTLDMQNVFPTDEGCWWWNLADFARCKKNINIITHLCTSHNTYAIRCWWQKDIQIRTLDHSSLKRSNSKIYVNVLRNSSSQHWMHPPPALHNLIRPFRRQIIICLRAFPL